MATLIVPLRCAINTSTGNLENVSKAMEGFIDSIPGSRTDISGYTEVIDLCLNWECQAVK